VRPVYVHEICHALCEQTLGLGNAGEWLQEAMANRYALDVSRQDLSPLVRQGLEDPAARSSLGELLNGEPIALNRYWQAVAVLEWLLADDARRQQLWAVLPEFRTRGSTDLRPLAEATFGLTLDQMDQAWRDWAATRYARPGNQP
jgi:hypothetical protein